MYEIDARSTPWGFLAKKDRALVMLTEFWLPAVLGEGCLQDFDYFRY